MQGARKWGRHPPFDRLCLEVKGRTTVVLPEVELGEHTHRLNGCRTKVLGEIELGGPFYGLDQRRTLDLHKLTRASRGHAARREAFRVRRR